MKPQCETTADCLEQLARVMREFEFTTIREALASDYIRNEGCHSWDSPRDFADPTKWSFAIAKLEDKPVFVGSEVFHPKLGYVKAVQVMDGELFSTKEATDSMFRYRTNEYSWTPPKQTVTLKVGDNEPIEVEKAEEVRIHTGLGATDTIITHATVEAAEQFRKAMKTLVKENDK